MERKDIIEIMDKLLTEIEEEDIGISLLATFCQNESELSFFKVDDCERVLKILRRLSDDSKRHKEMLEKIISAFGEKIYEG